MLGSFLLWFQNLLGKTSRSPEICVTLSHTASTSCIVHETPAIGVNLSDPCILSGDISIQSSIPVLVSVSKLIASEVTIESVVLASLVVATGADAVLILPAPIDCVVAADDC